MNAVSIETVLRMTIAVLAGFLLVLALALSLVGFGKWSSARLKAAVRKCGPFAVGFFLVWGVLLADSQNMTQDEKEDLIEESSEEDEDDSLLGGILLGRPMFAGSYAGSDDRMTGESAPTDQDERVTVWGLEPENMPAVRAPTGSDYAAGFALTSIGTNETFDFTPPEGAAVYEPWMRFGAARHWFRLGIRDQGSGIGDRGSGERVDALTVFSDGLLRLRTKDTGSFLAPLHADLCLAPAYWWDQFVGSVVTSRFWSAQTSWGGHLFTWENALLDRDDSKPVSFQVEIDSDGTVDFRYDLSRLDASDHTKLVIGVGNDGSGRVFTELQPGTTSLKWRRLDPTRADDQDPDGDGITTADEIVLYQTDPYSSDTDRDGFADDAEIAAGADPNAANSLRTDVPDAIAAVLGDLDPFSCPAGSTNTLFEHVFYTGTADAPFAYPVSSDSTAVLDVTVSGLGSGRLVIGDTIVPLVPRPRPPLLMGAAGASDPTANTLHVPVPRGTVQHCTFYVPESLEVAITSSDFVYGELPTFLHPRGWLAFPNTEASHPCIHDLNARRVAVSLDPGFAAEGLTCTWNPTGSVDVRRTGDLSAELKGDFPPNTTTPITYTLSHPQYICGETDYTQAVRFCPQIDDDDLPEGDGCHVDEEHGPDEWCDCGNCEIPWCPCSCHDRDLIPLDDDCPVHGCPWESCEYLHHTAYEASNTFQPHPDVLKLGRNPPDTDEIEIDAPEGLTYCCPCPEHWTNKVSLAYKSYNLAVRDEAGERFTEATRDCSVFVNGISPSRAIGDSTLMFCKTGVVYEAHDYTVLGMRIESYGVDLQRLNEINSSFGLPVNVQTNVASAQTLLLRTDVRLPDGDVHLAFEGDGPKMQLWLWNYERDSCSLLLDSEDRPSLDIPISRWRRLVASATYDRVTEVRLLVFSEGSRRLVFGYSLETSEGVVRDEASQVITAIRPPLLPDYNRDGSIGSEDAEALSNGRTLYFWCNEDIWTGDNAFAPYTRGVHPWPITLPSNGNDMIVNGRNDLVNLCPFAVDLSVLKRNWRSADLVYEFLTGDPGYIRFVEVKTGWDEVGEIVKNDQETVLGSALHTATLRTTSRGDDGTEDGYGFSGEMEQLNAQGKGILAVEFARSCWRDLRIRVRERNSRSPLIDFPVAVAILDVHDMYRWVNLEAACGASVAAKYNSRNWVAWPDSEHADANVVFVHGYNVHPDEAWDWSQAMFKRLWWSGMDAGFTAVLWRGNETQVWVPGKNAYATPNYHQNVLNAFRTASALKTASDSLPGAKKYYIAHSLGNMFVSAAKQDYGLEYEKYVMLNAAVPIEAYDSEGGITAESKFAQTPPDWRDYPDRVRATHWHDLFPDGDARRTLTWSNRFVNVDNTINFYSSKDEVLANGGDYVDDLLSRDFAWYNQERMRGRFLVSASPQAGWVFNDGYGKPTVVGHNHGDPVYGTRRYNPSETYEITDGALMSCPFFRDFRDEEIYGESGSSFVRDNPYIRWYALSHGIPAESFAAGANPVPKWDEERNNGSDVEDRDTVVKNVIGNIDMAVHCGRGATKEKPVKWIHSYFIQFPLYNTSKLYEMLVEIINERNKGGSK